MIKNERDYFKTLDKGRYMNVIDAVKEDSIGVFNVLLKQGANLNLSDEKGRTALHYAAQKNDIFYVRNLVFAGADVTARDDNGLTPLCALYKEQWYNDVSESAEVLLSAGADVNATDKDGMTPLKYAKQNDDKFGVEFLTMHGAKE